MSLVRTMALISLIHLLNLESRLGSPYIPKWLLHTLSYASGLSMSYHGRVRLQDQQAFFSYGRTCIGIRLLLLYTRRVLRFARKDQSELKIVRISRT